MGSYKNQNETSQRIVHSSNSNVQAGVEHLSAGISLPLPRDPACPHLARAHVLREKMRTNLATAQERSVVN